jgi:hypothetical protein
LKLFEFCKTPNQKEIVKKRVQGATWAEIARDMGVDPTNARRAYKVVLGRAAKQGYSPDHDMTHTLPDGFKLKGTSTMYDAAGMQRMQWVKSMADEQRQTEILVERLEQGSSNFKRFKPTKAPKSVDTSMLSLITITDFHLGMYAWADETGDDWDCEIARDVFLESVHEMIRACPKSGIGVLNQLGDFLHWDGLLAVTPQSGHILDADTRYGKLVDLAMSVMTEACRMMLANFGEVRVIAAEGNHDMVGSIWLRKHLKHLFADEPRLSVDDTEFPYYAMLHGKTMLGFHHGHKMKMATLPKLFSSEPRYRSMWGAADHTYIHTGHLHHERVVEDAGAIVEQHPTLSGRDAYAARGGWVSMRGAKAITYDDVTGEVSRFTVRPRVA